MTAGGMTAADSAAAGSSLMRSEGEKASPGCTRRPLAAIEKRSGGASGARTSIASPANGASRSRAQGSDSSSAFNARTAADSISMAQKNEGPPRGGPSFGARDPSTHRSVHLLDAGERPAARATHRLGEVPDFLEALGLAGGRLADRAGEAHARPMLVALGRDLEQVGVEREHVGMLARAAASEHVALELLEELGAGEFTQLLQLALVVGDLQLHVIELGGAQEARDVEAVGNARPRARHGRGRALESRRLRRRRRGDRLVAKARVLHRLRAARALVREHAHEREHAEREEHREQDADHQAAHAVRAHQPAEHAAEREAAERRRPSCEPARGLRLCAGRGCALLRALSRRRLLSLLRRLGWRAWSYGALRADRPATAHAGRLRIDGDERGAEQPRCECQKNCLPHGASPSYMYGYPTAVCSPDAARPRRPPG